MADDEDDLDALSKLLFEEDDELVKDGSMKEELNHTPTQPVAKKPSRDEEEELSAMKAKMLEMERQLNELKKELNKQTTTNKQQQQTTTAQQIAMQQTATFAKKKRVAHNQVGTEPKKVKNEQRDGDMTNDTSYDTDPYSGLRIKDPLVSSVKMRERMSGRKMIKIPQIVSNVRNGDIEGDWVTIGTIVYKLPPKDTSKGSKYSVWKLSDLSSQTSVMALFLFDKAFENHWKTPIGHVIALLNPRIQTDRETNRSTGVSGLKSYSLSLDHPGKLMIVGVSADFITCQAVTKSGQQCQNFANKQHGGRCDYHIQGEYKKTMSKRMECQGGYAPNTLNIQEKLLKKSDVFHKGQWFSVEKAKSNSKEKKKEPNQLFGPSSRKRFNEMEQVLGKELAGNSVKKSKDGVYIHSGKNTLEKLMEGNTPGARCYRNYLSNRGAKQTGGPSTLKGATIKTPLQLLQEHSMKKSENDKQEGDKENVPKLSEPFEMELFVPDKVILPPNKLGSNIPSKAKMPLAGNEANTKATTKVSLTRGSLNSFDYKEKGKVKKRMAKANALDVLSNGKDHKEDIRKRVECNIKEDEPSHGKDFSGLDMNEIERILKAKSSHQDIVQQDERLVEDMYFTQLSKKEAIEEKLGNLKELNVRVFKCIECNYVDERAGDLCKRENHSLSRLRAIKRRFRCSSCNYCLYTYNSLYPVHNCQCGENKFKQTSLYNVRNGPKLPGEELSLRGDEQKFLNSLN